MLMHENLYLMVHWDMVDYGYKSIDHQNGIHRWLSSLSNHSLSFLTHQTPHDFSYVFLFLNYLPKWRGNFYFFRTTIEDIDYLYLIQCKTSGNKINCT